ncbi:MAG TPA: uracil-DNA glycosylase family protein [Sphingomonas sp.]|uniref:uracil-DNA glycosylase family protein n=1 Tax=Sphingomonas sp. TaxID=28214 RepID=UPI002BCCC1B5|nr:uracil-DNA glycosylase family protein [Sphingomonas sp.]HMI18237.1 uracil-DNA glycosylase family protein [Sphingomonas sp.]
MIDGVALSALDWWAEAGVDTLADDLPRNWLAAAPVLSESVAAAPAQAKAALPDTLAAFRAFLLADASIPGPPKGRVDASGDAASGVVIVVDMPESEDRISGNLLSGEVGALFDRMLGAINLGRDQVYLIPFSPVRATTGKLGEAELTKLTPLLLHHLALAAPRKLLLLGDAPVQALLRKPAAQARDTVHQLAIADGEVPTVASIHPRMVHLRRDYRALAWADLQRFETL